MKNILVTGANGQLGSELQRLGAISPSNWFFTDIDQLDITNRSAVEQFIAENKIEIIVNCAAYTNVDKAESDEATAQLINCTAVDNLCHAAKQNNSTLIHISTDYVFGTQGNTPRTEDMPVDPLGAYGRTKLAGEQAIAESQCKAIIIRTAWLYREYGNNFVKTMLRLGNDRDELNVVADQIGSPTYTFDLAVLLCDMAVSDKYGIYHATNEGICSWAEFAREIMALGCRKARVNDITSDQYPAKAKRPLNSRMSKDKLEANGFARLPHWRDALKRYVDELKQNNLI